MSKSKIVRELAEALIAKDRQPYFDMRAALILSHGYDQFRDLQSKAMEVALYRPEELYIREKISNSLKELK